jgi:hypothetical protein
MLRGVDGGLRSLAALMLAASKIDRADRCQASKSCEEDQ